MGKYIVRVTGYVYYKPIEVEASSRDEAIEKVREGDPWEAADHEVNFDVEEK